MVEQLMLFPGLITVCLFLNNRVTHLKHKNLFWFFVIYVVITVLYLNVYLQFCL